MALTDFFRINFPYGIKRNQNGEWFAFNREYMPLGWNSTGKKISAFDDKVHSEFPIHTKYKGVTELKLKKLAHAENAITLDGKGKINQVYLYDDRTNPKSNPEHWNKYFEKIKILSSFDIK